MKHEIASSFSSVGHVCSTGLWPQIIRSQSSVPYCLCDSIIFLLSGQLHLSQSDHHHSSSNIDDYFIGCSSDLPQLMYFTYWAGFTYENAHSNVIIRGCAWSNRGHVLFLCLNCYDGME